MFDASLRRVIDPPLNAAGARLARRGVSADQVTLAGLAIGLGAALAICGGMFVLALLLILASRLADGLDGAVARASRKTDVGGFLDIVADFAFYGAVPLAFVVHDPAANGLAGAFLLAAFYVNGTSFLGYAILAEKRRMHTSAQGQKTLYYSNGLLEGAETIALFLAICLFPNLFPPLAWIFGALCLVTATLRVLAARRVFADA
ncbi:Phosphatidylglycerophosphate synthase [Oceanicola granulosus HTCC2516]|uniref:Phosphatidylglycerophosphate synthase n=1 Tax=Oceanicola granulosus (strain ATCC BAA-861 / DSM 15982 / KCTC 12143 / HTCC2516) TaxID=314256 RepID=Q2CDJ7_OCEGH|nr:CDP-alcohol phosphatidyltransferase family protein [Oceanicola granulosus]EAR50714.1 Phosphatidylglycerophosphate synthase [Oceanicola granulosus HTCC2516]